MNAEKEYAFTCKAQQWRADPYYVASSSTVHKITVVASTKAGAIEEAKRILGEPDSGRYWRVFVLEAVDVRVAAREIEAEARS
jgi:hypothetical protein